VFDFYFILFYFNVTTSTTFLPMFYVRVTITSYL